MLLVKTPLFIIAIIVLAILGFFISGTVLNSDTALVNAMFSVGVISTAVVLGILSALTQSKSSSSSDSSAKPATTKAPRVPVSSDGAATLYVGNLSYKANEHIVKELFEKYGTVVSVRLMKDKRTGKRKGFGFVEVKSEDAEKMISTLNDSEFMERTMKVRPAKEKVE